jgi:two-component system response regulator YesN
MIIDEYVNGDKLGGISVQLESGKYAALLNTDKTIETIIQAADQVKRNIKNLLGTTITIVIGRSVTGLSEIHAAYLETLEAVKKRVVLGSDSIIICDQIMNSNAERFLVSTINDKQLFDYVRSNNVEEVIKVLERLISTAQRDPNYPGEDIINLFYSVLGQSVRTVIEKGWSLSEIFDEKSELYRELIDNENIYDMSAWLFTILRKMSHFMLDKKESKNKTVIQIILAYMRENYPKDITLNYMAEKVYLSPSYLSKIFKELTGKNFLEYLTEIRIEASKLLLKESNYKITKINEQVNLGNVQNFIRIFKKHEGITPGQYRESHIKTNLRHTEAREDICDG